MPHPTASKRRLGGPGQHSIHSERAPSRWARRELWLALLLVLATFGAYWQVYGAGYGRQDGKIAENPGFIWDDEDYVLQNPHLPDPQGLKRIWLQREESPQYYPLVFTTFWLEYRLWGGPDANGKLKAAGYHVTNILLHAVNALLVWGVLRRLRFRGAFAVAAVFALHPFCVESVAWVTERKNVLSLFFYLLAMHALFRWEERTDGRRWAWWGLAFGLFLLGLFSKTVIASLPVAMVILRWWRRRPLTAGYVLPLVPFLLLGFGMGQLTAEHEKDIVLWGDIGPNWQLSFADRILIAGRALWFYMGKILWPHPLVFNYPRWNLDAGSITQWLWPLAALVGAGWLIYHARRGRRGLLAGGLFYAVALFPALGFVNVAPMRFSFVADHFAYLASLAVMTVAVGLVVEGFDRLRGRRGEAAVQAASPPGSPGRTGSPHGQGALEVPAASLPKLALAILAVMLIVLGGLTWKQTSIYRDIEFLWRDTIAHYPESHLARINLGVLLRRRGEIEEARTQFAQVLKDWPDWPWTRSRALTNLGNLEQQAGHLDEAIRLFREASAVQPVALEPRYNLANALLRKGALEDAIRSFETLLEEHPEHVQARYNLGYALEQLGRIDEADAHYAQVTRLAPAFALGWTGMARVAQRKGSPERAVDCYRQARRLDPSLGAAVLGELETLLQVGRRDEGMQLARTILGRGPAGTGLRFEVARTLRGCGEHAEAVRLLREGLEGSPGDARLNMLLAEELASAPDPEVRSGEEALAIAQRLSASAGGDSPSELSILAVAYAELGRFPEAEATMRRAIGIAREGGMSDLVLVLMERLALFEARRPFRLP
jgi:tetratricopeptide (TPR) repeat protein